MTETNKELDEQDQLESQENAFSLRLVDLLREAARHADWREQIKLVNRAAAATAGWAAGYSKNPFQASEVVATAQAMLDRVEAFFIGQDVEARKPELRWARTAAGADMERRLRTFGSYRHTISKTLVGLGF